MTTKCQCYYKLFDLVFLGFKNASMTRNYQKINTLKVSEKLLSFVNNDLLKDTNIEPKEFWEGFDKAVNELAPINMKLIKTREDLQKKLIIGI